MFIRFDLRGASAVPARFDTRIAPFAALRLTTIEASGRSVSQAWPLDRLTPTAGTWRMSAPLPGDPAGALAIVAQIDRPRFAALLTEARLSPAPPLNPAP